MKTLKTAGIIALLLNAAGILVNYLAYRMSGHLLLKIQSFGGEITLEFGFGGLVLRHIYGMARDDVTTHTMKFNPAFFLISLVLTVIAVWIVISAAKKLTGK